MRKICQSHESVVAHVHRGSAGVIRRAGKCYLPFEKTGDVRNDARRVMIFIQHRPLFNVHFQEIADVIRISGGIERLVGIVPQVFHGFSQPYPVQVSSFFQVARVHPSGKRARTKHAAEASFFIAKGDQLYGIIDG